jgi:acetyltransferase-like isoleucine patch superfamily enzyme
MAHFMDIPIFNKAKKINRYPYYISKLWGWYILPRYLRLYGISVGSRVQFYGMPIVTKFDASKIEVGDDCVICSRSDSTDLGVNHPVILRTLRKGAEIVIGSHTGISGGSICAAVRVEIGRECLIGANVTIVDTDFHPLKSDSRRYNTNQEEIAASAIYIEDNVFIGAGVIILKGVRIGKNSVIGACAVVTKNIPNNSVVAGNPAIIINKVIC